MTDTASEPLSWFQREEQRLDALLPKQKAAILKAAKDLNLDEIRVSYDGAGDEGQINEVNAIRCLPDDGGEENSSLRPIRSTLMRNIMNPSIISPRTLPGTSSSATTPASRSTMAASESSSSKSATVGSRSSAAIDTSPPKPTP